MTTIALTGDWFEAVRLHAMLEDRGFHPQPLQPDMQVTHTGGEMGYPIAVPSDEAEHAARALAESGLGKWLVRAPRTPRSRR
jgi:hypothetical protein